MSDQQLVDELVIARIVSIEVFFLGFAEFEQRKIKTILLKPEPLDFTLRLQNWLEEMITAIRS